MHDQKGKSLVRFLTGEGRKREKRRVPELRSIVAESTVVNGRAEGTSSNWRPEPVEWGVSKSER